MLSPLTLEPAPLLWRFKRLQPAAEPRKPSGSVPGVKREDVTVSELAPRTLSQALAGEPDAVRELVDGLMPVVQSRIARTLLRSGRGRERDVRQELEDLCQEVFASLFENDARALRAWHPAGGLSLAGFVGFVAERQVLSILRSGRRNPWTEDPTLAETLDASMEAGQGPEPRIASRELLSLLLARLREELSPKGLQLFELLLVEGQSVNEVREKTGLQPDAIYAWKSRLSRRLRALALELDADPTAPAPTPPASSSRGTGGRHQLGS